MCRIEHINGSVAVASWCMLGHVLAAAVLHYLFLICEVPLVTKYAHNLEIQQFVLNFNLLL